MGILKTGMRPVAIDPAALAPWGALWTGTVNSTGGAKNAECFDKKQGMDFGKVLDRHVANSLAEMLGDIPIVTPGHEALLPPQDDCIELGDTRVIGGVRPQNFDLAYRPDGVRIAYDSKTLNDRTSVGKNWQNMINDLATESTTVHTRFPYAIVAFIVAIPRPALAAAQEFDIIRTLERMASRRSVQNQNHLAEVISLVVWDPGNGMVDQAAPDPTSVLRIEKFSSILYPIYVERYKGLPPHERS